MDNINDLIGDAAKQLMAQADGIQNQKLKASAQRVAQTISAKTRDELISVARSDSYGRDTRFIKYLPITWRQKAVMGRVYSFQCTTNKDGTPGEFRMSLATAGKDLNDNKPTYVSVLGLEAARRHAAELCDRAQTALQRSALLDTATLAQLADMVVERDS